ncbi:MAG: endo alpha-1,4 polygalactosaminidase [Flavobacteriaceae bacterium]|nr:endo alpha-1,4 polygalactosaminidase [Flavobacteriaceae bacterium]
MKFSFFTSLLIGISLLYNCSDADDTIIIDDDSPNASIYIPTPGTTFEWRLDELPTNFTTEAEVIDIDAFDATPELVAILQAQDKRVIAYLSVGSVEDFREDASDFPPEIIGNVYEGFEDENWLDVRQIDLLAPIMRARLDMIQEKGFDGIEPDNINGYQNNTGFNLTEEDAKVYSRWLIEEAHSRGLSIGQKNAEELIPEMVDEFDWLLTEDAFVDDFYQQLSPYISANKAVFFVEYTDQISQEDFQNLVCPEATSQNFSAVLKDRDLTDVTFYCN